MYRVPACKTVTAYHSCILLFLLVQCAGLYTHRVKLLCMLLLIDQKKSLIGKDFYFSGQFYFIQYEKKQI
jgi:hypothetical protein